MRSVGCACRGSRRCRPRRSGPPSSRSYWDHPLDPSASLMELGTSLGYRVVAPDRPGYGASHGLVGDDVRIATQVPVLFDLIDRVRETGPIGAGVFLVGHSMGAILAVHMAASERGADLLGMEICGLPFQFREGAFDRDALARADFLPMSTVEGHRNLFYGPDGTFDPAVLQADAEMSRPVPAAEIIDAVDCGIDMATLAPRVTIPVQYTIAEFERSSVASPEILARASALFTSAPRVVPHWQVGSGHNISLHRVARAYHLRALAFFDEILAAGQGS
ncbi:MAG: alpha/beta fold hydrolase [Acidobacteria bacterium]|nr:alpha/beta fold hydrolase [Acidobacteriota bacterium]